ncbi:hypothetical protein C8J36_102451 [Rhizobium sp. PP-F2F-G48]|uniref:hypothetical protein n=1 Tax=Rhizobium sp. PP-F2F-G48 TaxID=2135651 RepID=UPI00104E119F|nr:hypothetical protein [Rhizobium sp. PP-F2F-G48]TCM57648.1 hypothetical protein C8J36_102451 [Rhizobium sp. PP-F2F-G48]
MRIRFKKIMEGPGPSEVVIEVQTVEGTEEIIVDASILKDGAIDVGSVISQRDGQFLIELPREASSGRMRAWIGDDAVAKDSVAA